MSGFKMLKVSLFQGNTEDDVTFLIIYMVVGGEVEFISQVQMDEETSRSGGDFQLVRSARVVVKPGLWDLLSVLIQVYSVSI